MGIQGMDLVKRVEWSMTDWNRSPSAAEIYP